MAVSILMPGVAAPDPGREALKSQHFPEPQNVRIGLPCGDFMVIYADLVTLLIETQRSNAFCPDLPKHLVFSSLEDLSHRIVITYISSDSFSCK